MSVVTQAMSVANLRVRSHPPCSHSWSEHSSHLFSQQATNRPSAHALVSTCSSIDQYILTTNNIDGVIKSTFTLIAIAPVSLWPQSAANNFSNMGLVHFWDRQQHDTKACAEFLIVELRASDLPMSCSRQLWPYLVVCKAQLVPEQLGCTQSLASIQWRRGRRLSQLCQACHTTSRLRPS